MSQEPRCPKCESSNTYQDGFLWNCPDCSHEWNPDLAAAPDSLISEPGVRDASGNPLQTGDSVTVIKDLKVGNSSLVVKVGTKVKNIRVIDAEDGHNIACKIEGVGALNLKSEFVRKV